MPLTGVKNGGTHADEDGLATKLVRPPSTRVSSQVAMVMDAWGVCLF